MRSDFRLTCLSKAGVEFGFGERLKMAVTAKDVARELNLSQTTVSRIFSGDQRNRMSEETRQRVLETARRLGYQPNAVASSLRRGRTDTVGLHTSRHCDARNEFYATLIGSLQDCCHQHDLDLLLHSVKDNIPLETMVAKLTDKRVDGLILRATSNDPLIDLLKASSLPVVALADPLDGIPTVTCDSKSGMNMLVDHLWAKGYRKFVYLAPSVPLADIEIRRSAFEANLRKRQLAGADRRVLRIDFEQAHAALPELLASGERLAVCCWNDRTAYNLLGACAANQVPVPERLAVTGFDGFEDHRNNAQRLVTIACPWEAVAVKALELLVQMIDKRADAPIEIPAVLSLPVSLRDGNTA